MTERYVIGHDALPKMGRIKTGLTGRNVPKLNLNEIESDYTSSESPRTESEYSGLKNFKLKISKTPFLGASGFGSEFSPLNYFFKRRASYHFKAYQFRNLCAFEFFQLLNKNIFKGTLKIGFCIDIRAIVTI